MIRRAQALSTVCIVVLCYMDLSTAEADSYPGFYIGQKVPNLQTPFSPYVNTLNQHQLTPASSVGHPGIFEPPQLAVRSPLHHQQPLGFQSTPPLHQQFPLSQRKQTPQFATPRAIPFRTQPPRTQAPYTTFRPTAPQQITRAQPIQSAPQNKIAPKRQNNNGQYSTNRPIRPTTTTTPLSSFSTQAGPSSILPPRADLYLPGGRQLKQYEVYEHIDNDIEQEPEYFIPANFFLMEYHDNISATIPTDPNAPVLVEARSSRQQQQQQQQQRQQQQQQQQQLQQRQQQQSAAQFNQQGRTQSGQRTNNPLSLGSGALGFVRLPNGNVHLGSGSLGYISGVQRMAEIQDARTRTGSRIADALHFGHGPLSDSLYFHTNEF